MKLKYMGIITDRKDGVEVYYKICDGKVKDVIQKIILGNR
jgi:DNA-binding transcriptional ArsR family regulator